MCECVSCSVPCACVTLQAKSTNRGSNSQPRPREEKEEASSEVEGGREEFQLHEQQNEARVRVSSKIWQRRGGKERRDEISMCCLRRKE